jgi:glutamate--cysteine ligase
MGLELELLSVQLDQPARPAPFPSIERALAELTLPFASCVTLEPGGQVELSTRPLAGIDACDALAADASALGAALAREGVGLLAVGLEPGPRRPRVVRNARYDAMEQYFDARGPAGCTMMRSTAALQVNVSLCDDAPSRWHAAHAIGPVLAAAFANSPFGDSRPSGWRSTRLAVWTALDPARSRPVGGSSDCCDQWAEYALRAPVMMMRTSACEYAPIVTRLTFDEWVEHGHELGWPTVDDLQYHLTTLFPMVRPKGWLELRMIDSLPDPWWRVASAVTVALLHVWPREPSLERVVAPVYDLWDHAARDGLDDPRFALAAASCFDIAREALGDLGADTETIAAVEEFTEQFVSRGRCPADELLDRWHRCGALLPALETAPEPAWA